MSPDKEAKFLAKVASHYESAPEPRRVRRQAALTSVGAGVLVAVATILFDSDVLTPLEAALIVFGLGALLGGRIILLAAYKNTYRVAPFVDVEGLRRRVAELEATAAADPH